MPSNFILIFVDESVFARVLLYKNNPLNIQVAINDGGLDSLDWTYDNTTPKKLVREINRNDWHDVIWYSCIWTQIMVRSTDLKSNIGFIITIIEQWKRHIPILLIWTLEVCLFLH